MGRYVIRRLLITIPIILAVAIIIFSLLYITPGDPALMILGSDASDEELASYREYLGIDRPFLVQLGDYLYRLFIKMDLGESWVYRTNITYEIGNRLPRTFGICLYSIAVGAVLGIPLGVAAAVHQNGKIDKIVLFMSSVMTCIPNYVYAFLLIIVFALKLKWLPAYGIGGIKYYILPCVSIMLGSFSGMARQMRSSMLEVIRSDYVMAAKAQGFSKRSVNYAHALPNALIPIVTMLTSQLAGGLGGTMILETIFSIPGMGLYIQGGITKRDIPVVTGCSVFLAIWFCVVMVLLDVLYAAVDPRIRSQYAARGERRVKK
jgi:peptide/nickel transport system permease protein